MQVKKKTLYENTVSKEVKLKNILILFLQFFHEGCDVLYLKAQYSQALLHEKSRFSIKKFEKRDRFTWCR